MQKKSIGLFVHSHRADRLEKTAEVIACLKGFSMEAYVEKWLSEELGGKVPVMDKPVNCVIALGGDGTLLRAAQYAISWDVPLLGINLGRVGFLTEVEHESLEEAITLLANGAYTLEERMLLDVCVNGVCRFKAVNDAVVSRNGYARLVSIDASVSGDFIGRYRADGMVVSSPTGSTGYSLSAGGPIVSPDVQCIILSPICAHSLQHRPVVVSAEKIIHLTLLGDADQSFALIIDGQEASALKLNDTVTVQKADLTLKLIRFKQARFFALVQSKLNEWTR